MASYPSRRGRAGPSSYAEVDSDVDESDNEVFFSDDDEKTLWVGQPVTARFRNSLRFYAATIRKINDDGTYEVEYADGDREGNVKARDIRPTGIGTITSVPALLKKLNLARWSDKFEEVGYDDLQLILSLDEGVLHQLVADVKMDDATAQHFIDGMKRLRAQAAQRAPDLDAPANDGPARAPGGQGGAARSVPSGPPPLAFSPAPTATLTVTADGPWSECCELSENSAFQWRPPPQESVRGGCH